MELIKWSNENNCTTCVNTFDCATPDTQQSASSCSEDDIKYYAHKDDISAMVEWAEGRHRNQPDSIVICDHLNKDCHEVECDCAAPIVEKKRWTPWGCELAKDQQCRLVAYRGNPEAKEEAPKEYVCVSKIDPCLLSTTAFNPKILKEMIRCGGWFEYKKGQTFTIKTTDGRAEELEKLGFIEEAVQDYVVNVGDCFKYMRSSDRYRIVLCGCDQYLMSNIDGSTHWGGVKEIYEELKLSDFAGEDSLKDFKPCKIKTTEVKD